MKASCDGRGSNEQSEHSGAGTKILPRNTNTVPISPPEAGTTVCTVGSKYRIPTVKVCSRETVPLYEGRAPVARRSLGVLITRCDRVTRLVRRRGCDGAGGGGRS